jgi:hypothetical protein
LFRIWLILKMVIQCKIFNIDRKGIEVASVGWLYFDEKRVYTIDKVTVLFWAIHLQY